MLDRGETGGQPPVDTQLAIQLHRLGPFPPSGTSCMGPKPNIGWTLGNACPYRCPHCYSAMIRRADADITVEDVDRVVEQLVSIGVGTVNLGGNEPLYTCGPNPHNTVLPYIIEELHKAGIKVGLTTAGVTMTYLARHHPHVLGMLNDCDISLDSPFPDEHNKNRGADLFNHAMRVAEICRDHNIPRTFVMCVMNWNASEAHLQGLVDLAVREETFVRFNFMKPTEPEHMAIVPSAEQFFAAMQFIFKNCMVVELGEPLGSAMAGLKSRGCPCGTSSFRIHSKTADGHIPLSPCVYGHAFKGGYDLLVDDLAEIVASPLFEAFRQRRRDPSTIAECQDCELLDLCRGGCPSRAYLWRHLSGGDGAFRDIKDPYCLKEFGPGGQSAFVPVMTRQGMILVHRDYLCTVIFEPGNPTPVRR